MERAADANSIAVATCQYVHNQNVPRLIQFLDKNIQQEAEIDEESPTDEYVSISE